MARKDCPKCGRSVSVSYIRCPYCSTSLVKEKKLGGEHEEKGLMMDGKKPMSLKNKMILAIVVVIAAALVMALVRWNSHSVMQGLSR